jgi:chromosome segregation ATPase
LTTTVTTLHKELQDDIKNASETHKLEMTKLEERLQSAQATKYDDLAKKLQTNYEEHDERVKKLEAENLHLQQTVNDHSEKIISQAHQTAQLTEKLEALSLQMESNQQNHDEFETGVNEDIIELRKATKTSIHLANSVEQHGRRWTIRLLGMKAPEGKKSKQQAKEKIVAIIHDIFKLHQFVLLT